MAGTPENLATTWSLIRNPHKDGCSVGIATEEPRDIKDQPKFLGCHQIEGTAVMNGKEVRTMTYDMSDFMRQCVQSYKDLAGDPNMKLRKVDTPFPPVDRPGVPRDAHLILDHAVVVDVAVDV